jgi:hypothetical protein
MPHDRLRHHFVLAAGIASLAATILAPLTAQTPTPLQAGNGQQPPPATTEPQGRGQNQGRGGARGLWQGPMDETR